MFFSVFIFVHNWWVFPHITTGLCMYVHTYICVYIPIVQYGTSQLQVQHHIRATHTETINEMHEHVSFHMWEVYTHISILANTHV